MSDPVSALSGANYDGFATVREIGPVGMISLRAAPSTKGLAAAVKAVTGTKVPGLREIVHLEGGRSAAWMSPDEYLLIMPYTDVAKALLQLSAKLTPAHHLAVDVSDARAVFRIGGEKADQVIRKICPVDLDGLPSGEFRRTRAAQVACAIWRDADGFTLVCFRSVATYVMALLTHSAEPGSALA